MKRDANRVNKVTPVSLGYPLSIFNKNSTLRGVLQSGSYRRCSKHIRAWGGGGGYFPFFLTRHEQDTTSLIGDFLKKPPRRGDGSEPRLYQFLVQKIAVGVRNDQMLEVILIKFNSWFSFGVASGSNTVTSSSLGYPLSVFNKNSPLKHEYQGEEAIMMSARKCHS